MIDGKAPSSPTPEGDVSLCSALNFWLTTTARCNTGVMSVLVLDFMRFLTEQPQHKCAAPQIADWSEIHKCTQRITANFTVEAHICRSKYSLVSERHLSAVCLCERLRLTASSALSD